MLSFSASRLALLTAGVAFAGAATAQNDPYVDPAGVQPDPGFVEGSGPVVAPGYETTDYDVETGSVDADYSTTVDADYTRERSSRDVLTGPYQGAWEFLLGGSGSSDQDFDANNISVDVTLGYYLTDTVEVGVRQNVSVAGNEDDTSWNGATTGFIDYVFDFDAFRPFVGVSLGYLYGDDTNDTFIGGPEAGVKYYIKDDAFVFGRVNYDFLFDSGDEIDDNFEDGRFVYSIGLGINF